MNGTGLAPWAVDPWRSRGRRIDEGSAAPRTEHQRDRDRIVHSTAFRRLVYKTQVFVNHEGDLFRTRLTHSLEVAQLGRSIARQLRLNEELIEALALAHDLGHTPFGHAGQDVLNQCMAGHGGFEHNLQSLRVVDKLEQRYPEFDGLNLSFETREGILKHCSRHHAELMCAAEPDGPARRFLDGTQPSLEAQIVNLADEVAYNAHDVDDGVRSGLITMEQLDELALYARFRDEALAAHPKLLAMPPRRLLFETLRRLLSALVYDLIDETNRQLARHQPEDADALRRLPRIAAFSDEVREPLSELKRFLFKELYRHPQVVDVTVRARTVVAELFAAYVSAPQEMPADYAGASDFHRAVADYIAGMTDRFALREHQRLTGRDLFAL
ncbi:MULTISPECIES: deoxyguanosinetriphosphate triphosphohydrolase [Rubrivivax]|uniref:Deoxyguanosinetriphosphate triphosphohydrolase-like protein n=1 Tax=Rubrivivax benzoatilyticus TaxID=316997 RepID=A0ABX0HPL9_9BURK|nr:MULTISPECIES: deoxyguanosinetriphosphate triphosphohydrolase [Rubrivivax]EGJ08879.1 deoxyguanosinetriphosphate triphosphohydrolase-like protein [Rubrivivax benzoatilyticus JA2 = ATCC BAA-35]NHK97026.1 deoxyguanosinetriphosphate triphosphohydrolase [Rubrivivax benzoatilyticus]NHL24741.1 deoxyguanosinetriphosphate triphosphohydrolase [Rubrivivax benzoatilyticus]